MKREHRLATRGDTAVIPLRDVVDEQGNPLDLTGWEVTFTAKKFTKDTEAVFVKSTLPGDGIVIVAEGADVTLDEADTALGRTLVYDAEARKDGRVITIEKGTITVQVDVTTEETVLVINGGDAWSY